MIQAQGVNHPANSFYVYEQVYDQQGNPIEGLYVDRNGDGVINDEDRYFCHKPAADVTMALLLNWYGSMGFQFLTSFQPRELCI